MKGDCRVNLLEPSLEPVHQRREYHGDLHAWNILIRRRGIGFQVKVIDFFDLGRPTLRKISDDVVDLAHLLYQLVGGRRTYTRQAPIVKQICLGLHASRIRSRFPNAGELRAFLDSYEWT